MRRRLKGFIVYFAMLAILFVSLGNAHPPDIPSPLSMGLLLLSVGALSTPLHIAVQEAGHAVAARLVGYRVSFVRLGSGPEVAAFPVFGTMVQIGTHLFREGLTHVYAAPAIATRWRMALILLGGFGASLSFSLTLFAGLWALSPFVSGHVLPSVYLIGLVLAVSELFRAPVCLWPRSYRRTQMASISDGLAIVRLLRKDRAKAADEFSYNILEGSRLTALGRWAQARAHYESALERNMAQPQCIAGLLHVLGREAGSKAVVEWFEAHRDHVDEPAALIPEEWSLVLGNAAWQMVRLRDPELLPVALEYAARAAAVPAPDPAVIATLAAAAMADSQPEARAMLVEAIPKIEDPRDRAEFIAFLGDEAARQGDASTEAALRRLEARLQKAA